MDAKKINEQFELIFKTKIERNIAPLEAERKKLNQLSSIALTVIFIVLAVVLIICFGFKESGLVGYAVGLFFLSVVLFMVIIAPRQSKYRKELKSKLLSNILSIFGKFHFSDRQVISLKEIKTNGLFRNATAKKDDDVIVGKYKDIDISITETKLTHTEQSGESRSTKTDFSGLILRIKMNKNFEGHTVVRQKPLSYEQFLNNLRALKQKNTALIPSEIFNMVESPMTKLAFQAMNLTDKRNKFSLSLDDGIGLRVNLNSAKVPKNLEEVKLEDPEFNNIFDIFSDNQVEARYLLTTSFMERLKNISTVMLVLDVHCIFKDGYITLFLGHPITEAMFKDYGFFELEPKKGETLYNKEVYKRVFVELLMIFDFIHHFKLEQKIGL